MTIAHRLTATLLAFGMAALSTTALAAFPDKAVRLIVPFTAGGAADVMARGMAQRMTAELGQQVIVENHGGAGGQTAAEEAAKSAPDGYTLFFGTLGTQAINRALYPKLRYDPVKDFVPIALTHITPRVLVVGSSVPAHSIAELIALAKSKPGGLTFGSAGNGSTGHLSGALFESMAGVEMVHIPYKGSAPLLTDMLAGRIDMTFDSYTVYRQYIESGRVRALGVTSTQRMKALPQVPTIAEAGLKGYDVSNWLGVLAPAGTPGDVVATLNAAIGRAMATPALREQLFKLGIEPTFSTPQEFAALIRTDLPKWAEIVKKSGASLN
jgi:tripartite-type tricarboxylate transporter receptor subunit TctC